MGEGCVGRAWWSEAASMRGSLFLSCTCVLYAILLTPNGLVKDSEQQPLRI